MNEHGTTAREKRGALHFINAPYQSGDRNVNFPRSLPYLAFIRFKISWNFLPAQLIDS